MTAVPNFPPAPVGQQGPPARAPASPEGAPPRARGGHRIKTGAGASRA